MLSLTSAWDLAAQSIQKAQERYKRNYDKRSTYTTTSLRVGGWVLVHMPQDESGPQRKLSRPWHGPYRIVSISDPDVLLTKVYFPQDRTIQVHQSRVKACPPKFPAAFYWYGGRRRGPGRPPRWVSRVLDAHTPADPGEADTTSGEPETTSDSGVDSEDSADQASDSASDPATAPASVDTNDTNGIQPPKSNDRSPLNTSNTSNSAPRPACKYPLRNRRSGRTLITGGSDVTGTQRLLL